MINKNMIDTVSLNYYEQLGVSGIINDLAKKHPSIKKVILYGSKARGDFLEDSDIDLFFVCDANVPRSVKYEIYDNIYEYELLYNIVVSAIFISETDFRDKVSTFIMMVKKEGVILWSRE